MTEPRTPKLAYLTQPEPGRVFLNLQFEGAPGITRGLASFERVELNGDQLRNILADGVGMVCCGLVPPSTFEAP